MHFPIVFSRYLSNFLFGKNLLPKKANKKPPFFRSRLFLDKWILYWFLKQFLNFLLLNIAKKTLVRSINTSIHIIYAEFLQNNCLYDTDKCSRSKDTPSPARSNFLDFFRKNCKRNGPAAKPSFCGRSPGREDLFFNVRYLPEMVTALPVLLFRFRSPALFFPFQAEFHRAFQVG